MLVNVSGFNRETVYTIATSTTAFVDKVPLSETTRSNTRWPPSDAELRIVLARAAHVEAHLSDVHEVDAEVVAEAFPYLLCAVFTR